MIGDQAHQLLHGYRSGHGQIAGSVKLAARDSELVTRLSDLSGSLSSGLQVESYLTVYPLPSQNFFALARTWPDPDAPRAGCVLTHTLLVPVERWAALANIRSLDDLFRNPHSHPEYAFTEPINLPSKAQIVTPRDFSLDLPRSRAFVSRYFGQGLRPIVWFNAGEPEEYLWRLLEHLWPKLRGAFSCCTFSLQQRALQDRPFDLLFAPSAVYSRFTKLSAEHVIEPTLERKVLPADAEPWTQYWAEALFSADLGLPTHESELPIWTELGEDPTAVRKLSLVHELRLRAAQSPTAGVGAIDVVESLAREADAALPLKRLVLGDAIDAAASAQPAQDALSSLRLIEDRLRRESFRSVAADFYSRLTSAVSKITSREPEAAVELSATWLAESRAGSKSAFVDGVMSGLCDVANSAPSRLEVLRSHPDVATEILRLEPTLAPTYLQVGGDDASHVLAGWLSSINDANTLRQARKSLLPSLQNLEQEELLSALLREMAEVEVKEILNVLSEKSDGFADQNVRSVVSDRISSVYPHLVRQWGSETTNWTHGVALTVASAYEHNRHGFDELLDGSELNRRRQAEVLSAMLSAQTSGSTPYWLRELMSQDARIIKTLLLAEPDVSDYVEAALSKVLDEASDLSLARSDELLQSVLRFENRPVFPQLFDAAMRSAIGSYVSDGIDTTAVRDFLSNPRAARWLKGVSGSQLASLLVRNCHSGASAVTRAMRWISEAPRALYERRPSVVPELCDSLLLRVRQFPSDTVQSSMIQIVRRAGSEAGLEVRQALSAKMLRFGFDNVTLPLGALVAEVFADIYLEAVKENGRPPSFLASLFGAYDWDKGKDLRISLIDSFLRSDWAPGDLAVAASNAGILRKVFKRLQRKSKGDHYLRSMLKDLSQRTAPDTSKIREHLQSLIADPDFYEEWD